MRTSPTHIEQLFGFESRDNHSLAVQQEPPRPHGFIASRLRIIVIAASSLLIAAGALAQTPTITLQGATQVTGSSANINATVNPNGSTTAFVLRWGTTTTYDHTSNYGQLAAGTTPVAVVLQVTGLSPSTLYHYMVVATNAAGITDSPDMTFTTTSQPPMVPTITANAATDITTGSATITGTVNPNGLLSGCWLVWGTNTAYGRYAWLASVPAGLTPVTVSNRVTLLTPNTTYHYQIIATNGAGQGASPDLTFTTLDGPPEAPPPPSVTTQPATSVTGFSATLNGYVSTTPSSSTSYHFRWGTNTDYGNDLPVVAVPDNYGSLPVSQQLTGLIPGMTFHFQLVATNTGGIAYGADQAFTTQPGVTIGGHTFIYLVTNGTATITAYSGPGGTIAVPATVNNLPVTTIADGAFAYNNAVTNVTIPSGVVILGAAFTEDLNLASVTLPSTLASIGDNAFNYCQVLTNVVIPDSVTNVGASAFAWCTGLTSLKIGNHVAFLGSQAFYCCFSLTSVSIPDSVTRIDDGVLYFGGPLGLFTQCTSLTNVTVGSGLAYLGYGTFCMCPNLAGVYFRGNAPALNGSMFGERMFDYSDLAIVYYLPGTTGWSSTFCGRPTMLWNASMQSADGTFGMKQNRFAFTVTGTAGIPVVIDACTDLLAGAWTPVQSGTLTNGAFSFTDLDCTNYPARFYRVRTP